MVALGQDRFRIFGTLAVKNVSRPVILEASMVGKNSRLTGAENIFLHASTTISRSAFNMDNFAALVGDNVTINITIQARLHQAV